MADLVEPLYALMAEHVRASHMVATDDTILPMLAKGKTANARMWVYVGDASQPYNIFDFTLHRGRDGPLQFLKGYDQVRVADAYGGYNGPAADDRITHRLLGASATKVHRCRKGRSGDLSFRCPDLMAVRRLALSLRAVLSSRDGQQMRDWIQFAKQFDIPPLVRFAFGLQRDLSAVLAAVNTSWSNGQVEGQINRLKMIKRQMYRRTGLRLLQARLYLRGHSPTAVSNEHRELHQMSGRAHNMPTPLASAVPYQQSAAETFPRKDAVHTALASFGPRVRSPV